MCVFLEHLSNFRHPTWRWLLKSLARVVDELESQSVQPQRRVHIVVMKIVLQLQYKKRRIVILLHCACELIFCEFVA